MTNKIKELVTQEMDNNFNYCDDGEHKYSLNNKLRDMK
jgi:hypothetical protein